MTAAFGEGKPLEHRRRETVDRHSPSTSSPMASEPTPSAPPPPEYPSAPVDPRNAVIEVDDTTSDEGYAESTTTSYVTSIASSIRKGVEENGRLYANYGQHLSALPIDDHEVSLSDEIDVASIIRHPLAFI